MNFEAIPAKELDRWVQQGWIVIDLRPPEEYWERHIKGAVNIPYEELEERFSFPREQKFILYCERGSVSMAAARELASRNYQVKTVVGGIRAYRGPSLVSGNR